MSNATSVESTIAKAVNHLKMVSKIIKKISKLPNKGVQNNTAINFNFNVVDIMESHFLNQ